LVWDRAPIHRSKKVTVYLAEHPEIVVEWLPPYAPEINPEEFCHGNVKQQIKNATPVDKYEVFSKLQNWLKQRFQAVLDESDSHKSTIRFMILFEKTIRSSIVVDPSRVVFNLPLFCPNRADIGSRGSILCYYASVKSER
jgi:hypothetical protein